MGNRDWPPIVYQWLTMQGSSFRLFEQDLKNNKAPDTCKVYLDRFSDFTRKQGIADTDRLTSLEPRAFEDMIKAYIDSRANTVKFSYLNQAVSALRRFCLANRINLNFDWIYSQIPKAEAQQIEDIPYTKDQILAMVNKASLPAKISILIMATGGPRIGALPTLRIDPAFMVWIEKYSLYCLQAYPKTTANYWIVLPPKISDIVKAYKGNRTKGPLLVQIDDKAEPLKYKGIINGIARAAIEAKVRKVHKGNHLQRHNVMLDHGLRKFHSTMLEKAGLRDDHIARLRGNKKGLKGIYQLPNPLEIIELTNFMSAVPLLDFNPLPIIK